MAKDKVISEEAIKNDDLLTITNRQLNLTYMIAGCFMQAFQDMQVYLEKTNSQLNHQNRHLCNELLRTSKRTVFLIEQLQKVSCLTLDADALYEHDDGAYKMYSLLMEIISIVGSDPTSEVRAYTLYKALKGFKHHLVFPQAELRNKIAWDFTQKKVDRGDFGTVKVVNIPKGWLEKADYISEKQGVDFALIRNPKTKDYHVTICGTEFKSEPHKTIKESFEDVLKQVETKTDWFKV